MGMGGIAGNMFVNMPAERTGYLHKGLSFAGYELCDCSMYDDEEGSFLEAGGFTEELAVAFNDVDLCMKIRKAGYLIVYTPYARLTHYESKSRGLEDSREKGETF